MMLLGRWLADAIRLAASLALALLAMQVPALTHDYISALLQVSQELSRDIEQREDAARQFYNQIGAPADQVIATLDTREPSNAETLRHSIARTQLLRDTYDRIEGAPPLLRPVITLLDTFSDTVGAKAAVMRTALQSFTPGIALTTAAAIYGLAGLLIGSLAADMLLAAAGLLRRRGGNRRHRF